MTLKEEFEKKFKDNAIAFTPEISEYVFLYENLDGLISWIEQQIKSACDKQKKECALTYEDTIQKDERYQETYYRILNSPYPEGVEK